jgi:hypothetical protein
MRGCIEAESLDRAFIRGLIEVGEPSESLDKRINGGLKP